jgi:hypothetical protein
LFIPVATTLYGAITDWRNDTRSPTRIRDASASVLQRSATTSASRPIFTTRVRVPRPPGVERQSPGERILVDREIATQI